MVKVNPKPLIYQKNYLPNGELKSWYQYIDRSKEKRRKGILVPKWCIYWYSLILLAILNILISALIVVVFARRPGLYQEDCIRRSCTKNMNLKCIENICQCDDMSFYEMGCIAKKQYSEKCHGNSTHCQDNMSLSCLDGVCKCVSTQYWNGSMCTNKSSINQPCTSDDQCLTQSMLFCNTNTSKCECDSTRAWDANGSVCYLKRSYTEDCRSTQCQEWKYFQCISNRCQCNSSNYYDPSKDMCNQKLAENMTCSGTYECFTPMTCTAGSNMCQCGPLEYHNLTNLSCIAKRTYTGTCSVDFNCRVDKYLECKTGTCKCISGYQWSTGFDRCIQPSTYNSACFATSDCDTKQSLICKTTPTNNCTCPISVATSNCDCTRIAGNEQYWNGTSCVATSAFNQTCSVDYMCQTLTQKTLCNSTRCTCPYLSFFNTTSSACESQKTVNSICSQADACRLDLGLICTVSTCKCNSATQFWDGTKCTNYFTYDTESCTANLQCNAFLGLVCRTNAFTCNCPSVVTGKCDCPTQVFGDEHYWNGTTCTASLTYNQTCNADYMCQAHTENTICNSTRCTCSYLSFFNTTSSICETQKTVNDDCSQADACRSDLGLSCTASLCKCNSATQFWDGTKCTNYYTYDTESCTADAQCNAFVGLICRTNALTCNCPNSVSNKCDCTRLSGNEQYWNGTTCIASLTYNQTCSVDYMCQTLTQNTICNSTRCTCPYLSFYNTITLTCDAQRTVNSSCSQADACRLDLGLICTVSTCICNSATQFWDGTKCTNYYTYNTESCIADSQCNAFVGLVCRTNALTCNCPSAVSSKCDCPTRVSGNERYWNGTTCISSRSFNQTCGFNYMCQTVTQNTICNSTRCTCPYLSFYNTITLTCDAQRTVNSSCSQADACRLDLGLICTASTCICNSATQFWDGTKCTNYYTYNSQACTADSQCNAFVGLVCRTNALTCNCPSVVSSKCDCPTRVSGNERYWNGTSCVATVSFNQTCSFTYMCQTVTQGTICNSTRCTCPYLSFYNTITLTCDAQRTVNSSCSQANACRFDLGLICTASSCKCNSATQFWDGTKCTNYYTYNSQACTADSQCNPFVGLVCRTNALTCNCPSAVTSKCDCPTRVSGNERYWNGTSCVTANTFGGSCLGDYMCRPLTELTQCVLITNKCSCSSTTAWSAVNQICTSCDSGWNLYQGSCYMSSTDKLYLWAASACANKATSFMAKLRNEDMSSFSTYQDYYFNEVNVIGSNYDSTYWGNGPPGSECFRINKDTGLIENHQCHDAHFFICQYIII